MATSFTYTVGVDFLNGADLGRLTQEIQQSAITIALSHIQREDSSISIHFKADLSPADKTILDGDVSPAAGLVGSHVGTPLVEKQLVDLDVPKTADGRIRSAYEKSDGSRLTRVTHDFSDKTTWFTTSVLVEDEALVEITGESNPPSSPSQREAYYVQPLAVGAWLGKEGKVALWSGDAWNFVDPPDGWSFAVRKAYVVSHDFLIDLYHGKVWSEDKILDENDASYRLSLTVDSVGKAEKDPHNNAGDFLAFYEEGLIFFDSANPSGQAVELTYHYAVDSHYVFAPSAGKKINLESVDVQFTSDIVLTDSTVFEVWGIVDYFAPQLLQSNGGPFPSGTKVPIDTTYYKTMRDFQAECDRAYPSYPVMGGDGWRGLKASVIVFHWEYIRGVPLLHSLGMELHIYLQHDTPYLGTYATATLYSVSEDEA